MKVAPLVHVSKSLKYLKAPVADFRLRERLDPIFHKLVEIALLEKKRSVQIQQEHNNGAVEYLLSITYLPCIPL